MEGSSFLSRFLLAACRKAYIEYRVKGLLPGDSVSPSMKYDMAERNVAREVSIRAECIED